MSIITCTSNCIYQDDGYCSLERTASAGQLLEPADDTCVYFIESQNPPQTGAVSKKKR